MGLWSYVSSVLIAVVVGPFLSILLGVALTLIRGEQSVADASTVVLLSPIAAVVLAVIASVWSLPATALVAGLSSLFRRHVWTSPWPNVAIAVVCICIVPAMLSRYPNGDGGSMQSLVEEMKAAVAMSIAVWCLYSAYALRHAG